MRIFRSSKVHFKLPLLVLVLFFVIVFTIEAGCSFNKDAIAKEQLPPGMAHLNKAPAGHNFEGFFQESTVQSELFRRKLLEGGDPNFISAELIAKAIMKFRRQAPRYLKKRKNIDV